MIPYAKNSAAFFWDAAEVMTGSIFLESYIATGMLFSASYFQEPPALNDTVEFKVSLSPGNYNLNLFGSKGALSCIEEIHQDGSVIATIDRYSATFEADQLDVIPITLTETITTFQSVVTGAGTGGGFYVSLTRVWINKA